MDPITFGVAMARAGDFIGRHWRAFALAGLVAFAAVQTARVGRLKPQLAAARAEQINPATRKPWKAEALAAARDLNTCRANTGRLEGAVERQNAAMAAARAEGDRMAAAAAKAAHDLRGARAVAESRARATLSATVDAATCEAREAQMLEMLEGAVR